MLHSRGATPTQNTAPNACDVRHPIIKDKKKMLDGPYPVEASHLVVLMCALSRRINGGPVGD